MPAESTISLKFPEPDIAMLVFDDRGRSVNVLSRAVVAELADHLDTLEKRTDIRGLVLASAKPNCFIAGADVKELAARLDAPKSEILEYCRTGRKIYQRLSELPFVTVAAISGYALGGGWELALFADGRIFCNDPHTAVGFPEVKLGLIPGWGGTWTAARIAGLGNAVELVCGGESILADRAKLLGLADEVVEAGDLIPASIRWIRAQLENSRKWESTRHERKLPIVWNDSEVAFLEASAKSYIMKQTHGNYPAPLAGLQVLTESVGISRDEACDKGAAAMTELVGTPVNRALLNIFFITERNKRIENSTKPRRASASFNSAVNEKKTQSSPVKKLGIVGTGIMGVGIAAAALKNGVEVLIFDRNSESLAVGRTKIIEEVSFDKQTRKIDPARGEKFALRLITAESLEQFADCEVTIEAIAETRANKLELFNRLAPIVSPTALIASNTSTFQTSELARSVTNPGRFCGLHFFNPVRKLPLVEVIRGAETDEQTILAATSFIKLIGKTPIVVNDGPGFMVNRVLSRYLNESLTLVHEGVPFEEIDLAMIEFGMPIGPVAIYDLVGFDTAIMAGKTMYDAYRERFVATNVLIELYRHGRLGRKSGAGFYKYDPDNLRSETIKLYPDPDVYPLLDGLIAPQKSMPREKIVERLLLAMVHEATYVLEDHVADDPRDIDLGVILGLGHPPFRGGILFWADTLGIEKIATTIAGFARDLGERWKPSPRLLRMQSEKRGFYS